MREGRKTVCLMEEYLNKTINTRMSIRRFLSKWSLFVVTAFAHKIIRFLLCGCSRKHPTTDTYSTHAHAHGRTYGMQNVHCIRRQEGR